MSLVKRSPATLSLPDRGVCELDRRDVMLALMLASLATLVAWHALGFAHLEFEAPLVYMGDALHYQYLYEITFFDGGWTGLIDRAGAPFGTQQLDFPNIDGSNLLLMWVGDVFGGGPFVAFNTYVLLTFPICASVTYLVKRRLGIGLPWAFVGALAFTMLPFHFQRLGHVFFLGYFCAALAFWLALDVVAGQRGTHSRGAPRWLIAVAAAICGTSGAYYAFFSCLFIVVVAMHASASEGKFQPIRRGVLVCCIVLAASTANLAPTIWHVLTEGGNSSVAKRSASESETYGLKLAQLLMPRDGHRVPALAQMRAHYEATAPLSNENHTASLGFFGAFGFVVLLLVPFLGRLRRFVPELVKTATAPAYAGLLYATIGGFGSIFAILASPQLRGLNRISPFLGFLGILCISALLDTVVRQHATRWTRGLTFIVVPTLCACILFDQVSVGGPFWKPVHAELMHRFYRDRAYYAEVEHLLGSDAMVMQLPLIGYPEAPPVKNMGSYDSLPAILHTKGMRWSAGAMTGRSTEHWQRLFEAFPLGERTRALAALGFAGVDVDVRGFGDERPALIAELEQHGFRQIATSSDEQNIMLAVPDALAPDQRRLAVTPATGWLSIESSSGTAWWWSAGTATLDVGNVSARPRACHIQLTLESYLVPRTVSLWEGGEKLAEISLQPSTPTQLSARLDASPRVHRLTLRTDASSNSSEADPRALAYRLLAKEIPLCE